MPSSTPPAMDLLGSDEKGNGNAPLNISSHDWRRLQDVDLDDIVTEYGIKSASTKLNDRSSLKIREPFRYGMKDVTTTVDCLPDHLRQQIDSLVASGRTWYTRSMQVQGKSQPALQTQLPLSFESWRAPSALDLGAPVTEMERCLSPHVKPWQQIAQGKGPAMKLYLANVQSHIERRMIQQFKVQAAFRPEQWANSDGQEELQRLEKRHESFQRDLDDMGRKRKSHMSSNLALTPSTMHGQTPSSEKTTQPPRCHSKKTSPVTENPIRRILVVWDVSSERRALDRLAPGFLKQFHGWVDLQQVATPVLRVASGYFIGHSNSSMSLLDAMRTVGFRPGYSLQNRSYTLANRAAHDPGMDSVRTLGVLARLVAYPATIFSQMENEARAANNHHHRTCGFYLSGSMYPCTVLLRRNRNGRKAKIFYDTLPRSLHAMEGVLQLLRERGLAEPILLAPGNERRALRFEPKQVCIYYDTMQQINAVVAALDGATIDNVRLEAKIHWHPDPAWHCAFSQVPASPRTLSGEARWKEEARTVLKDIHYGPEPSVARSLDNTLSGKGNNALDGQPHPKKWLSLSKPKKLGKDGLRNRHGKQLSKRQIKKMKMQLKQRGHSAE